MSLFCFCQIQTNIKIEEKDKNVSQFFIFSESELCGDPLSTTSDKGSVDSRFVVLFKNLGDAMITEESPTLPSPSAYSNIVDHKYFTRKLNHGVRVYVATLFTPLSNDRQHLISLRGVTLHILYITV